MDMIKRVASSRRHGQQVEWPVGNDRPDDASLFRKRHPLRKIVIMIDADLMDDGPIVTPSQPDSLNQRPLLTGILKHPLVCCYRYADGGPPSMVQPSHVMHGRNLYDGWVVLESSEVHDRVPMAIHATESGYSLSSIEGNAADIASRDSA